MICLRKALLNFRNYVRLACVLENNSKGIE